MFSNLSKLSRAYRRLPEHHNFKELADNIETLANHFLDEGCRGMATGTIPSQPRWEWKLGADLKLLLDYARGNVPPDADGIHYYRGKGYTRPS